MRELSSSDHWTPPALEMASSMGRGLVSVMGKFLMAWVSFWTVMFSSGMKRSWSSVWAAVLSFQRVLASLMRLPFVVSLADSIFAMSCSAVWLGLKSMVMDGEGSALIAAPSL